MNVSRMTIDSLLHQSAVNSPHQIAVQAPDWRLTYLELDQRVTHLAAGLIGLGVTPGDRVAIMFLNDINYLVSYFAVLRAGAVVVPISTRLVTHEVTYQINHSESRVVLHGGEFADLLAEVAATDGSVVRHLIGAVDGISGRASIAEITERGRQAVTGLTLPVVGHADVAGIWYTSGTTGVPKGAIATHASSIWSAVGMALVVGVTSRSQVLAPAPLFHRGPMETLTLAGFLMGATHHLMAQFDPRGLLRSIEEFGITHSFIVPTMTYGVLNLPDRAEFNLASMECWLTASAPFPEDYRDRLEAETTLREGHVFNAYGITETLFNACLDPSQVQGHRGSVGRAVPGTMMKIVDSQRCPVGSGEVGEIAISGASIASGYVGDEEAWKAVTYDDHGRTWYLSGDLGRSDDDGYIYLVDRAKDMVISGGENVYSAEVEGVLQGHPAIAEVAVVGTPHERWGECVTAVVSLHEGANLTTEELDDYCHDRLASFKRPRRLFVIDVLPRNGFGKVRKNQVRDYAREALQHGSSPRDAFISD